MTATPSPVPASAVARVWKTDSMRWRQEVALPLEKIVKTGTAKEYFSFISCFTKRMEIRQIVCLTAIFGDKRSDLVFGLIDKKIINPTWANSGNLLYWYSSSSKEIWDGLEKRGVLPTWESRRGRNLWFSAPRQTDFCKWLKNKGVPSDKKDAGGETWWLHAVRILDANQLTKVLPYAKLSEEHFFVKDASGETALTALLGNRLFCGPESIRYKSFENPKYAEEVIAIVNAHLKINPALINEPGARERTPIIMALRSHNYALAEHLYRLGGSLDELLGKLGDAKLVRHVNARLSNTEDKELQFYAETILERTRSLLREQRLRAKIPFLPQIAKPKI